MAYNRMTNNKSTTQTKTITRYCKFCKDAGKSEAIYTSHHLRESRDPNSRIVCPALLETECRFGNVNLKRKFASSSLPMNLRSKAKGILPNSRLKHITPRA